MEWVVTLQAEFAQQNARLDQIEKALDSLHHVSKTVGDELEEQIISDLYSYRDPFTNHRVVEFAFHQKDAKLLGLGGPHTGADIVFCVNENYVYDHGESLSTAEGHQDTSTSPIFVAAGAGIKEGFEMQLYPREVDVAPTAAALLGVRFPAQCEGAPAYSILTEEL